MEAGAQKEMEKVKMEDHHDLVQWSKMGQELGITTRRDEKVQDHMALSLKMQVGRTTGQEQPPSLCSHAPLRMNIGQAISVPLCG